MRVELREETVSGLLMDLGVLPGGTRPRVRSLSGGVANVVLAVSWDGGAVVVKQALPELRVTARWEFDPARTRIERECLDYLAEVLPPGCVPRVVAYEPACDVLVMSMAPAQGVVWKDSLLRGEVDPAPARRLGALLGSIHREAAHSRGARERFAERWPLIQGRVDPFHRTVAAAHPELRDAIDREVDRLLATRTTLVLGDFSPKNVLVYPDNVMLLDFEVAHWGDPALDVAFLLTHLVLKARHRPDRAPALRDCAADFVAAYRTAAERSPADAAVIAELGCILLSRVDGKSPAEYLDPERDHAAIRTAAGMLLLDPPDDLEQALDAAFERARAAERIA
jgi:aminoglycoside phosphotransferase (APT) family kinase protein